MKKLIAIENPTDAPMWVAGAMIPPGEVRHFGEDELPVDYLQPPEPAPEMEPDVLAELMARKVPDVLAALPGLTEADLVRAAAIEVGAEKPRKTVMEALDAEALRRAAVQVGGGEIGGELGGDGGDGAEGQGA